jgi:hypothetical protein
VCSSAAARPIVGKLDHRQARVDLHYHVRFARVPSAGQIRSLKKSSRSRLTTEMLRGHAKLLARAVSVPRSRNITSPGIARSPACPWRLRGPAQSEREQVARCMPCGDRPGSLDLRRPLPLRETWPRLRCTAGLDRLPRVSSSPARAACRNQPRERPISALREYQPPCFFVHYLV